MWYRRRLLSQNFIQDPNLVRTLIRNSSLGPKDTVLDIGAGTGVITCELSKVCQRVVAIEIDNCLACHLKKRFENNSNVHIVAQDALKYSLPKFPYKVFANIPFSIEGKLIRKLLDNHNPPEDCYVIVRKDFAQRLSGISHETLFSLLHKPWFDFSILYEFKGSDFVPKTKVECVLWRITKKDKPLFPLSEKEQYQSFIIKAFGNGDTVKKNLRKFLSKEEVDKLSSKVGFSLKIKPSYLSFNQWLKLYYSLENNKRINLR